jgi:hypothetical protein
MPRPKQEILEELAEAAEELRRAEAVAKRRDELVVEATRADASRSEVGRAAGVSRGRVQQIVSEARADRALKAKRTQTGLALVVLAAGIGALIAVSSSDETAPMSEGPAKPMFTTAASVESEFALGGGSKAEWVAMHPNLWWRQIQMICNVSPEAARRYELQLGPRFRTSVLDRLRSECAA